MDTRLGEVTPFPPLWEIGADAGALEDAEVAAGREPSAIPHGGRRGRRRGGKEVKRIQGVGDIMDLINEELLSPHLS